MQKIFKPKSVAIIGASNTPGKIGNILMKNIQAKFSVAKNSPKTVKIFPVNLKAEKVEGTKAYPSVLDIKDEVDLAVIAIPAKFVNKAVEDCAQRENSIKNIIIISAGFGEAGEEGLARKEELEKLITKYDLNILGPNCLGIINAGDGINLSFAKKEVPAGGVGLISQSGAFITAMIDIAEKDEFGFSLIASLGNKIDINEVDLLNYYNQDENTKIIALYLEGISNGREFKRQLAKMNKPVVIIKAGTTQKTKQAIQSHTGSMAGESAVIEEVLKDSSAIAVNNLKDFVTILKVLNNFNPLQSNDLVIVTNAGGPGVITTDLIENSKLHLKEFTDEEKKILKSSLPSESSVNNPVDLLGDALADRYKNVLENLSEFSDVGGVLVLITPQSQTPVTEIMQVIADANQKFSFPVFPILIGGKSLELANEICRRANINNFVFPVNLIKALELINPRLESKSIAKKKKIKKTDNKLIGKLLSYKESIDIARQYDLNILEAEYPDNVSELEKVVNKLGLPLVMKVDSPNIVHKNAHNGVVVGLQTLAEAQIEFARFKKDFPGEKLLVQHQVESGLEIILGLKRDKSFGLILIIGLGGIITEILDEKILFVDEISEAQIRYKLENSKLLKILQKEKISENDLIDQALNLFKLGRQNPEIKEVDINPMFFYKNKEPIIVDFKIIIK